MPAPSSATSTSSTTSSPIASARHASSAEPEGEVLGALRTRGPADRVRLSAHSYTCLYLRTKRIEIRFITSVITNSVMPTAKIVL